MGKHKWVKSTVIKERRSIVKPEGFKVKITAYHSKECADAQRQYEEAVAEYKERWPNYCRECNGLGGHLDTYDPSPSGVALSPGYMTDFATCNACIEEGMCPRCGEQISDRDTEPCPNCGWNWGKNPNDALPEPPECFCWHLEDRPETVSEEIGGTNEDS